MPDETVDAVDDYVPKPRPPLSMCYLPRIPIVGDAVTEILGLPDSNWASVKIEFGNDEPAYATVVMPVRPHQLVALAQLTADHGQVHEERGDASI